MPQETEEEARPWNIPPPSDPRALRTRPDRKKDSDKALTKSVDDQVVVSAQGELEKTPTRVDGLAPTRAASLAESETSVAREEAKRLAAATRRSPVFPSGGRVDSAADTPRPVSLPNTRAAGARIASQPGASQPGPSQPGPSQPFPSQPSASQPSASQPGPSLSAVSSSDSQASASQSGASANAPGPPSDSIPPPPASVVATKRTALVGVLLLFIVSLAVYFLGLRFLDSDQNAPTGGSSATAAGSTPRISSAQRSVSSATRSVQSIPSVSAGASEASAAKPPAVLTAERQSSGSTGPTAAPSSTRSTTVSPELER